MNTISNSDNKSDDVVIVYDGECPFCTGYVRFIKLKNNVDHVELINARQDREITEVLAEKSIYLDEGMAVRYKGNWYHGHMAMHVLAVLSDDENPMQKLHKYIFGREKLAHLLYPVLRLGRNMTLFLLGKQKIKLSK